MEGNVQLIKLDGKERQLKLKVDSGMTWHGESNQRHVLLVPGERDIKPPRIS
jgi:hypothetical protein